MTDLSCRIQLSVFTSTETLTTGYMKEQRIRYPGPASIAAVRPCTCFGDCTSNHDTLPQLKGDPRTAPPYNVEARKRNMSGKNNSDIVPDRSFLRQLVYLDVPDNVIRYSSSDSDENDDTPKNVHFQLPLDFSTLSTFVNEFQGKAEMIEQNGSIIESSSLCLLKVASQERVIVDELDVDSPRDRVTSVQINTGLTWGRSLMHRTNGARSTSRNIYRSLSRGLPVSRLSTMDDGSDADNCVEFGRDIRPEGFHRFRRILSVQNLKGSPLEKTTKNAEPNPGSSEDESDSGQESHSLSCTF